MECFSDFAIGGCRVDFYASPLRFPGFDVFLSYPPIEKNSSTNAAKQIWPSSAKIKNMFQPRLKTKADDALPDFSEHCAEKASWLQSHFVSYLPWVSWCTVYALRSLLHYDLKIHSLNFGWFALALGITSCPSPPRSRTSVCSGLRPAQSARSWRRTLELPNPGLGSSKADDTAIGGLTGFNIDLNLWSAQEVCLGGSCMVEGWSMYRYIPKYRGAQYIRNQTLIGLSWL